MFTVIEYGSNVVLGEFDSEKKAKKFIRDSNFLTHRVRNNKYYIFK